MPFTKEYPMNSLKSSRLLAALGIGAAMTLLAGAASYAQTAPRGLPASPPQSQSQPQAQPEDRDSGTQGLRPYAPRDREARRAGRLDRRLDALHERLNIRSDQEGVWNSFANTVRDEAQARRDRFAQNRERFRDRQYDNRDSARRDDRQGPPSVVDRLERRQRVLEAQSGRTGHMLQAIRPLYDSFDQNQKRTADRLFARLTEDRGRFFMRRFANRFDRGFDRDRRGNDRGNDRGYDRAPNDTNRDNL
jgi:hypothetical protein